MLRRGGCVRRVWRLMLANAWSRRRGRWPNCGIDSEFGIEVVLQGPNFDSRFKRTSTSAYTWEDLWEGFDLVFVVTEMVMPAKIQSDKTADILASQQLK